MLIKCWFDGSCGPVNPKGHTGYGAIVLRGNETLFEQSGYVGVGEGMTNNVGEYAGIIAVLKFLIRSEIQQAVIYGDSDMVVKQLTGKWKARKGAYMPYYKEAIILRRQVPEVEIKWIPREKNTVADYLAGQAINRPRSFDEERELQKLIQSQREDRHDPKFKFIGYPKLIKQVNQSFGASRQTKGTPF